MDRKRLKGFTIVELLIVIAILSILASIIMPALAKARESARRIFCASNLRQIGLAFQMYVNENDDIYPVAQDPVNTSPYYWLWMGRGCRRFVTPYLGKNLRVLYCPSDDTAPQKWESTSYGYSMAFYHSPVQINGMKDKSATYSNPQPSVAQIVSQVEHPAEKVLAAEWLSNHDKPQNDPGWWGWEGSRNCLFADGHVEYRSARSIRPANDGFPDFNLTIDGTRGKDVD